MATDDVQLRPVGTVHPSGRCAFCGCRGCDMTMQIIATTRAWGWVCDDSVACLRRKQRSDQLPLFKARMRRVS